MEKMATELPLLVEMMAEITHEGPETTIGWCDDQTEFEFGSTYSSTASTVFVRSADNTRLVMSRTPTVRLSGRSRPFELRASRGDGRLGKGQMTQQASGTWRQRRPRSCRTRGKGHSSRSSR